MLCLQETKVPDSGFPAAEVGELGYQAAPYGTGRWNGVAILSRAGLDDVSDLLGGYGAWLSLAQPVG